VSALTRAAFVWIMLTVIALAVGMKVGGSAADLVGLYALAATMSLAAVLWAAGIALRFRSIQAGPLMQTPVFLILFLAPVYVPIDLLHGWVEAVAHVNPITAIVEAGRDFISGSPVDALLAFGAGLGLVVLFSVWALTGLRRAEAAGG
jgi:ABC-2 type transport system permease protein